MPRFCAVLNFSNHANRDKDKSNYHFPSIVKNNFGEGQKPLKVRTKKWLAQIYKKNLTEIKLERTRIKI